MRAILMAAGMGTRLRPITLTVPKSLIEINEMSLLERQIINLKERGIDEIILVTGYLHEKFESLVKKYDLIEVYNDKYDVYNNIYTIYLVRNYLRDAFVIDADNYLTRNFLPETKPETSLYFSAFKERIDGEWILKFDENNRVYGIEIANENSEPSYIMGGVSYWTEKDGEIIARRVKEAVEKDKLFDIYWDNIAVESFKDVNVHIEKINSSDIFEIDTLDDLEYLKSSVKIK